MRKISLVHESNRLAFVPNKDYYRYQYQLGIVVLVALLIAIPALFAVGKYPIWGAFLLSIPVVLLIADRANRLQHGQVEGVEIVLDCNKEVLLVGDKPPQPLKVVYGVKSKRFTQRYGDKFTISLMLERSGPLKIEDNLSYTDAEALAAMVAQFVGVDIVRE